MNRPDDGFKSRWSFKPARNHPNLTEEEWEAIGSLKEEQSSKQIIVKPNDKTGGCSILDYDSYVDAMKVKLCEQDTNARGENCAQIRTRETRRTQTELENN